MICDCGKHMFSLKVYLNKSTLFGLIKYKEGHDIYYCSDKKCTIIKAYEIFDINEFKEIGKQLREIRG